MEFSVENYNNLSLHRANNLFFQEIQYQPSILNESLKKYLENNYQIPIQTIIQLFNLESLNKINSINKIYFIGIGSSYYAVLIAKYFFYKRIKKLFNEFSNLQVPLIEICEAGEFLYFYNLGERDKDTLIFLISQSGESGEIVKILEKLGNVKFPKSNIFAITNTKNSTLDKNSSYSIYLYAGNELSVTNKTYLCTLLVINIISSILETYFKLKINGLKLENSKEIVEKAKEFLKEKLDLIKDQINICISQIQNFLSNWNEYSKQFINFIFNKNSSITNLKFINFLGNGTALSTSGQGALNTKEIARIYAESLSISMFNHGCVEIIDENYLAIIISNSEEDRISIDRLINNLINKWKVGKAILITNSSELKNKYENNNSIFVIFINIENEYLAPIVEIIPIQILLYTLAEMKNINPGTFKFSSKVTKII